MAHFGGGGGANPRFGRDTGPPPPSSHGGSGVYGGGSMSQQPPWVFPGHFQPPFGYSYPQTQALQGYYVNPLGYRIPYSGQYLLPGGRPAYPYPNVDADLPAANMSNSTGGVGCEPGYNYFFPAKHCKIHVFKTGSTPPWHLPPGFTVKFVPIHVPIQTTIGDLLRGFGATNPVAKKNKVTEVVPGGGGRWYSGISFNAGNDSDMKKSIKDCGWDDTRTGLSGEKPVVYVYVERG